MFHSGPIRPGTRGGQGDFSWAEVSADKDRENYLGHSINAPTGRWQKNKDVHWYNRDAQDSEQDRLDEKRRIKLAEEEAMAVALGFKPNPQSVGEGSSAENPNAIPVKSVEVADAGAGVEKAAKEEKRRLKEERRAAKEERRALRDRGRAKHHSSRQEERPARRDRTPERPRRYSSSPVPVRARTRYSRSPSPTRREYRVLRRSRSPRRSRSRSPQHRRERYSPRRTDHDERAPPRRR